MHLGTPACEQAKNLEETYTVDSFFGTCEGDSHDHDRRISPHFRACHYPKFSLGHGNL